MSFSYWIETPSEGRLEFHTEHHRNPHENIPCLMCERSIPVDAIKCQQCTVVRYCTRRCQLEHWAKHKIPCYQFKQFKQNNRSSTLVTTTSSSNTGEYKPNKKGWTKGKKNRDVEVMTPKDDEVDQSLQCSSCKRFCPQLRTCSKCKSARYCDPDCQRKHWPEHKNKCKLICKGMTASTGSDNGSQSQPTTADGPREGTLKKDESKTSQDKICAMCEKANLNPKKCSKCKTVFYCDEECQRKHWPLHKKVCDSSKAFEDIIKCSSCEKVNPEAKKCSKCIAVYYCNAECQKIHWPQHKEVCGEVCGHSSNRERDNTSKLFDKTEQHVQEVPTETHENNIQCFSCKKKNQSATKCTKCQFAYYCNAVCQRNDFSKHRLSCGNYPKFVETLALANPLLSSLHDRGATKMEYPPRRYSPLWGLFENSGNKGVLLEIVAPFHHFCRLGVYVQDVKGETIHMLFHHNSDEEIFLMPASLKNVLEPGNFIHWFYPRWHLFADGEIGFRIDSLHEMEFICKKRKLFKF